MADFTSKVREYRLEKGLTQEELARLVGVRRETIIRLENARYNPSLELAARLAHVLNISIEELFVFTF